MKRQQKTAAPAADGRGAGRGLSHRQVRRRVHPRVAVAHGAREASQSCRGCQIYCNATQAVFGEGPKDATVMFIGEQPGDQEDRAGKPFVGPAGQLLDEAMEQAGVPRSEAYVTNAVKHFEFEPPTSAASTPSPRRARSPPAARGWRRRSRSSSRR